MKLAHAALRHIDDLAERDQLPETIVDQLRMTYELRIQRLEPHAERNLAGGARPPAGSANCAGS